METLTLQRANAHLTRSIISRRPGKARNRAMAANRRPNAWQTAAIGVLALSMAVNTILLGWISRQEDQRRAAEARYREQIEEAERVRDLAVQELGAMSIRWAEEEQAREAQAEAYEAVGGYRYIGECTVTAYCCEPYKHICGTGDGITATGLPVSPGIVAVDPSVIPLGSTVVIDGQKYLAADTGVTGLCVDVAVPTHDEALERGARTASVWIEVERSDQHGNDQ